ncbi:protein spaetzle isoform X2 [Drosophila rhopaloa]|uniref:Protein spaetzle isoform X2 n=1 Tax=Drosophila rhopaloa TaxID=1041015 RepID=A0A6P4DZR1_DRORH|nr:protein spaetzle isoform X2 [Drosophila rhopaloa]
MTPMWQTLLKIMVLIFALITAIVLISCEMSKRHLAETSANNAASEVTMLRLILREMDSQKHGADQIEESIRKTFVVSDDPGLTVWNTTTADSAPFMPIPTKPGDPPQNQSPIPEPKHHYHQYHSLSQPDQYFKGTKPETVQADQPAQHRRPSDSKYWPPSKPLENATATAGHRPCGKDSNEEVKSFCSQVDNYPDLTALKTKLETKFAKFFLDDLQPTDVSARVGSTNEEEYLCKSSRRIMYPKKGLRADNTWQLIVNNEEFKQGIQFEECEGADLPCDYASNFANNYKPICRQHYVLQNLASIENEGKLDVVQQAFKIPSCCKCALLKLI